MKKIVINNLSEFIAVIEQNSLFECVSRGEHKKYDTPLRSAILRKKNPECYDELLQEYFSEYEAELSPLQTKHFIAFSQHHGIPTNLLDFSKSPLISLFFATESCNNEGHVYFIKKNKLVNASKVITAHDYGWGLLDDFLNLSTSVFTPLEKPLSLVFTNCSQEMADFFVTHLRDFINDYNMYHKCAKDGTLDKLESILDIFASEKAEAKLSTFEVGRTYSEFVDGFRSVYQLHQSFLNPKDFLDNYDKLLSSHCLTNTKYWTSIMLVLFLLKYESILRHHEMWNNRNNEIKIPFYFSYSPPIIDNRVKNQSSIFIVQPFAKRYFEEKELMCFWQVIIPDFEIAVKNPQSIQKELDALGINRKFVFCDHDNAAKYIANRYF